MMLNYQQKKSIFKSYQDLVEKSKGNERIDYEYPKSLQRGKILITQFHPSGNGYIIGKYLDNETIKLKGYKVDERGWINFKNFTRDELHEIIEIAMISMANKKKNQLVMEENDYKVGKEPVLQEETVGESLVRSCLFNWLGYGNINAPIWFLGVEEGGAEIWRNKTKTLEQSLLLRSQFNMNMDFCYVWEELYNIPLNAFKGPSVWQFIVAFLLEIEGENATSEKIYDFIFNKKQLGRLHSKHFLGELMPLPKKSKSSTDPYNTIWNSVNTYYDDIAEKRFSLIRDIIHKHQATKMIISYDRILTTLVKDNFSKSLYEIDSWHFKDQQYTFYKINLSKERAFYFLSTPFFGNGRISYEGIRDCVRRIKGCL